MIPDFPKAKRVIQEAQQQFFEDKQKLHLGPFFNNVPKRVMPEGNTIRQIYSPGMEHQTDIKAIKSSFNISLEEIKINPWIIFEKLAVSAEEFAHQQIQLFFETISKVTEMTGNVINAKKELSIDDFLDGIEKVEFPFDSNDNPVFPAFFASPEVIDKMLAKMKEDEATGNGTGRLQAIVEKKRKIWHDRKNARKLVD